MALNAIYALLISVFGGFFSGIIIAIIAKEELNSGMRYFKILSIIFLVGTLVMLIYSLVYKNYILLLSFIFLLGIPTGSLVARKYMRLLRRFIGKKIY